ncbi:MAG TPA: hypothetical protein VGQ41_23445 [Pyrinomonadaceae bacterium]|nr:hypothetical protein [Pyrinomonadaceae bacterium]
MNVEPIRLFGKDYFRNREGKLIELPSDMTASEVAQLEAEAIASEKKLGKGPPPQPVPDVKKLDKKEDKKTQLKPQPKGKKPGKGKSKRAPGAGAAAAMLKAVGTRKVAQYLASKAAPVVGKGFSKLQQLRQNQQKHDSADEKRAQSEQAVVIPDSEGQSKSNTGQVNVVSDRPAPKVDPGTGKQTLQQQLKENVPKRVEDVDNFKRDKKAQHTGAEVLKVIQVDKNAVVSTFQDMGHTPAPAPREFEPEPLPPTEAAPPTAALNLGKDGIAPFQKEHTDVSNFTKEADNKLTEEGVTQEQLDMVDSGDLASANKEKKGMEKTAQTEPLAVQKFAQDQNQKVETELKQQETKQRSEMSSKRKAGLGVTGEKQKGTKSALEKKREEVATKINGIYTAAQDKVKKKLADLETESMKRFDNGNTKATQQFEDNVNSELRDFKADRYSGWFGWARKVRDWWKGMDDLPEVKAIFDRNREKFVSTINKLVEDISADNKKVIQECKDELQNARTQIKDYVDKLGPALKDIGKKAAEEMNSKLDQMDSFIAKKEEDLQNQLKDKQTAAIKAIDEKIEKMKEAMAGALAKLGKLLLWAAKKFFTWALEKVGFSLSTIDSIINKGVAVLKAIFTQPIRFVKNLMSAAKTGFTNFGKNFLKHLKDALFEWLTGSLQGLQLPQTWDFKGIISVALQMIGISYQNIRQHMVSVMGEPVVAGLEKSFELVKTLITQGPMAAWEQLKEMAGEMRDAFIQAVKDFIKQKIIEQALIALGSIFIPGAGIIRAIIGIYDTIVFLIQKATTIIKMVGNFLGSVSEIAAGNIGAAAEALEQGLARGLVLVINFLAVIARLSGVTAKIREVIQNIRAKVDAVLLKVAKWIADKAKPFIAKGVGAVKAGVSAVKAGAASLVQWWRARRAFKSLEGESHSLSFRGEAQKAALFIASDPENLGSWANNRKASLERKKKYTKPKQTAYDNIRNLIRQLGEITYPKGPQATPTADMDKKIEALLKEIADNAIILGFKDEAVPVPRMVVNPGFSTGKAEGTTIVKFLYNSRDNRRPGSPTTGKEPLHGAFDELDKMGISANFWKRGHLLNKDFGGLAVNSNLVPIPTFINRRMESEFDKKVIEELYDKGEVIMMRFKVERAHANDPQKFFISHLNLEAGAMIEDTTDIKYKDPPTMKLTKPFTPDYPTPGGGATSTMGLQAFINAGNTRREDVADMAKATQLSNRLIRDMTLAGVDLQNDVEKIKDFIESKYNAQRLANYKSNFELVKAHIKL